MDGEFEQWVRLRTPALLRAAYLLTGDQASAEDLVQSALEKVAVAWPRIDGHPGAYARQVMYRLAVARWRRRARVKEQPVADAAMMLGGRDATSDVEQRVVMQQALRRLTRAQRAVLVLRFYEDLSEAETARVLGCTPGTVKSQTHRALLSLRRNAPELADLVGRTGVQV